MKQIDISVIIPTYKPNQYLIENIISLNRQTLSSSRFEIIIILNGCKEPWNTFVRHLIDKHLSGFKVVYIQTDIPGVSNARNIALDVAKGEYITFIDDDDYISPMYLEELIENSTKDCVGLSDSIYFLDQTNDLIYDNPQHLDYLKLKESESTSLYRSRRFFNGPVMKLIHRDIIGNRRFDTRFSNGEDSLFMALISDRIKSCKICKGEAIYYRRIRNGSASNTKREIWSIILNNMKCIKQYCIYWIKNPSRYNIPFLQSRILASTKNILTRLY